MKLPTILWTTCLYFGLVHAQYFSQGWAPGQPTTDVEPQAAPTYTPGSKPAPASEPIPPLSNLFNVNTLLSSGPAVSFFGRFGINITERLAVATEQAKYWDERVTLITDENYQDLIVNEPLTKEEESDRTWIIIISVTAGKQDGLSKYMDDIFDSAFNETQALSDLPNVRWGRIDYFNVTAVTTKWAIWQAPYLVVLKDRGKTLRFYRPQQLRLKDGAMREFLRNEDWRITPPWSSAYAPGGEREYVMDFLALWLTRIYNTVIKIPRWLLFVLSGSAASVIVNLLHRGSAKAPPPRTKPAPSKTSGNTAPAKQPATGVDTPQAHVKKRKATKGRK